MPMGRGPTSLAASATEDPVEWPQMIGVHAIGNVGMTVTGHGTYGTSIFNYGITDPETGTAAPSFRFPRGSSCNYLWGAALWIGGIINGDTLVSLAFDGMYIGGGDFRPPDPNGSVTLVGGPADKQLVAMYSDTIYRYTNPDSSHMRCLEVTERSCSWAYAPYDDFVIIDAYLKNVGDHLIEQMYVGMYFDADVDNFDGSSGSLGYDDDLVGYLDEYGIPYICDNDGDPNENGEWHEDDIRGVIGMTLIHSDPHAADTNFNWWMGGNSLGFNWGPQSVGYPPNPVHYFNDSSLGNPTSDIDKYYMLAHDETDYDMGDAAVIGEEDGWMDLPFEGLASILGMDARFVYSFGPYDVQPGDSIHIVYAIIGGENVHQNPANFADNFDIYEPDPYYAELDFSDLIANVDAARLLYQSGYALALQMGPVQGVSLQSTDESTAAISWLERQHADIVGYNVYIKPVPEDQILFREVVIGERDTSDMELLTIGGPITGTEYVIAGLEDGVTYFVSVSSATFFSEGAKSRPVYFTCGEPAAPDVNPEPHYVAATNDVTIDWSPSASQDISHYNIYRFDGRFAYSQRYVPRISIDIRIEGRPIHDSMLVIDGLDTTRYFFYHMEPYAQTAATDTAFTDFLRNEEVFYIITAVDDSGQESDTSHTYHVYAYNEPTKDVLVILENAYGTANIEKMDSVIAFYNQALTDYDYDYFILSDSTRDSICPGGVCFHPCPDSTCFGWTSLFPYRNIIIDENILKPMNERYDFLVPFDDILRDYVKTGGNLLYFGGMQGEMLTYDFKHLDRQYGEGDFPHDILGLDSISVSGLGLYIWQVLDDADTIGGLIHAESQQIGVPDLHIDTTFYWWNSPVKQIQFWFYSTPPQTGAAYGRDDTEVMFTYHSAYPASSIYENLPCGIRYHPDNGWCYTFLFHPWHMEWAESTELIRKIVSQTLTDVEDNDEPILPKILSVAQNYPNPFNPATTITYTLPTATEVSVDIYNILGRKTRTLVSERQRAGSHTVIWNGTDDHGLDVASGVYFYRIIAGTETRTKKMVVLK
ncbi:MAG: T9SS type A sorting domain-containing protein [candidate division Zixibacteria bacterium]|nr:T9SS type A sorting domain-containing protein [candidate division Zixibacteria bacterium]